MHMTNSVMKVILLLSRICGILSHCICRENTQEVRCTHDDVHTVKSSMSQLSTIHIGPSQDLVANILPFNNIHRLILSCNIQSLHFNSFTNHKSLRSLDMSENLLAKIPNGCFSSVPLLENLHLSRNKLENPTLETFQNLKNLKLLDLSYNRITKINLGVLDDMKKVERLLLNNNQICEVQLGLFDTLNDLSVLDLSFNNIHEIQSNLFQYTKKLTELNLAGNNFKQGISLHALSTVKILNLSKCKIEHLSNAMFNEIQKLTRVDLSNNEIFQLPSQLLHPVKDLMIIKLANCNLTQVPINFFDQNLKLEELDLSGNQLTTLPENLFRLTEEFKCLNLSHNSIEKLPTEIFDYSSLTEIDISYNEFTTIQLDVLHIETLQKVHLQNNKITYLHPETFANAKDPVKYIDIRNNRLVFIEEAFLEWTANLEQMEIFGNPWDCQCLEDLTKLLHERFIDYDSRRYHEGKLPICVVAPTNVCNYSDNIDFNYYFNAYQMPSIN